MIGSRGKTPCQTRTSKAMLWKCAAVWRIANALCKFGGDTSICFAQERLPQAFVRPLQGLGRIQGQDFGHLWTLSMIFHDAALICINIPIQWSSIMFDLICIHANHRHKPTIQMFPGSLRGLNNCCKNIPNSAGHTSTDPGGSWRSPHLSASKPESQQDPTGGKWLRQCIHQTMETIHQTTWNKHWVFGCFR